MAQVSKETTIGELQNRSQLRCNSYENGNALHRLPVFTDGVLEEAAMVHGFDADILVQQINDFLAQ